MVLFSILPVYTVFYKFESTREAGAGRQFAAEITYSSAQARGGLVGWRGGGRKGLSGICN